ncbi:leucine-rich repeat protein [Bacteroides sp.]|uniref:leucine-rich repeat protein n=1 Tax=Bacteroides sp. TaxID=29523 RepID=UPI00261A5C5B|nr:leucine-rich repeat protein [Bacteroides sp.]MDD3040803.1 leucine-rich repeat protein [Bacteroides sp.]
MNKKLIFILIAMICILAIVMVFDTVTVPTAAIWVDEGSASGTADEIPASWNANLKYMLFQIVFSDGSLNDIQSTTSLLEYDEVDGRLELISDNTVYVTGMAFSGYTGALANVYIPSTKTITVSSVEYAITVSEVTNTAFATSLNLVESIVFPSSVHTIAASTCARMTVLSSVTFQSENSADYSLSIGNNAFLSCSALETVTFNGDWNVASTISIGRYAFMACSTMKEMWFNSTTTTVPTFGTYAFFGTATTFRAFMLVTNRASYTTAIGAAKSVGFYDVTTAGVNLTTINGTLTWYVDKACTTTVTTPTNVDEGRYFAK